MPTDPEQDLVRVGRVGGPHGLDGAFVVEEASEDPSRFEIGAEFLVDDEPAVVVLSRPVGGRRVHRSTGGPSVPSSLFLRRTRRAPADSYYVSDLVGLTSPTSGTWGSGKFLFGPANDAELDTGLLLPLVEDCVREFDVTGRRLLLNPGFTG